MAEGLFTPEGQPIPVDPAGTEGAKSFAAAMAAPAEEREAPPKKAPRDREAVQEQPRKPRGRPPKHERARTAPKAAAPSLSKDEYAKGVTETVRMAAAVCEMAAGSVGPDHPSAYPLKADAFILESSAEAYGQACGDLAVSSPLFAKIISGGTQGAPILGFIFVNYQIITAIRNNHRNPEVAKQIVEAASNGLASAA